VDFATGLIIGKFLPYHRGHTLVIDRALARCAVVHVLVCAKQEHEIPGPTRARWVSRHRPAARVHLVDQDALGLADDDTTGWAAAARSIVGPVDAVFTSEDYGDAFAAALGCVHVPVDPSRTAVPISGSAIRASPADGEQFLEAAVRAWYVKRVCLLGAESTGKTTLAQDLAERYRTLWVPEYGHVYQALGRPEPTADWTSFEFLAIARLQAWYEDFLAGYANRVLFCDTDVFTTAVWQQRLMGRIDADVLALADRKYDLYVLCALDTPFAQDRWNLRIDGPHREQMQDAYRARIAELGVASVEAHGDRAQRVEQVVEALSPVLGATPAGAGAPRPSSTTTG
jgi:HTH-type transcriptional regulator, transcriptional repressor of NAD biosynthesis genes